MTQDQVASKADLSIVSFEQPYRSARRWMRSERWYGFLCIAITLACVLAANPFCGIGFNDDWSYAHVALKFAQTGHVHYNGWGPAMQLFQITWAGEWIRRFGFSFDFLRIITLPFSLGFVGLVYGLGRKAGLRTDLACFAALLVGTSPLYIPLAGSFMTEPYSCFFTALCLYAAMSCVEATGTRTAIVWLWVLTLSGLIGGADRQTVWVAPLALIPYAFLSRRGERVFWWHAAAAYVACVSCIGFLAIRFTQPYPGLELPKEHAVSMLLQNLAPGSGKLVGLLLTCAQVLLPALLCFVPFWRKLKRSEIAALLSASGALVLVSICSGAGAAPFAGSVLSGYGVLLRGAEGLGYRPELLSPLLRIAISVLIAFSGLFVMSGKAKHDSMRRAPRTVFAIFCFAYVPLLVPGAITGFVHDRYVLPLAPVLAIFVLHRFQSQRRAVPKLAWALIALLAIYGMVITHDYASAARGRARAAEALERMGVSREHVSAGLEYDGWTALEAGSSIRPLRYGDHIEWNATNVFWFWDRVPAVHPDYVAVTARASDAADGVLPRIAFTAWTPPFRRAVIVRKREHLPKTQICTTGLPCFL